MDFAISSRTSSFSSFDSSPKKGALAVRNTLQGVRKYLEDKVDRVSSYTESSRAGTSTNGSTRTRRKKRQVYNPDFLESLAKRNLVARSSSTRNVKVITGSNALEMYRDYFGEQVNGVESNLTRSLPPRVVFAFTCWRSGKKVVEYYRTWRRPTRKNSNGQLLDQARKVKQRMSGFLDAEFEKVMDRLDSEFKRMSVVPQEQSDSTPPLDPIPSAVESKSSAPTDKLNNPEEPTVQPEVSKEEDELLPPPRIGAKLNDPRPFSTAISVVSLPFLSGIKRNAGTALPSSLNSAERGPLQAANPDSNISNTTSSKSSAPGSDIVTSNGSSVEPTSASKNKLSPLNPNSKKHESSTKSSRSISDPGVSSGATEDSQPSSTTKSGDSEAASIRRHRSRSRKSKRAPSNDMESSPSRATSESDDHFEGKLSKSELDQLSEFTIVVLNEETKSSWHGLGDEQLKSLKLPETTAKGDTISWWAPLVDQESEELDDSSCTSSCSEDSVDERPVVPWRHIDSLFARKFKRHTSAASEYRAPTNYGPIVPWRAFTEPAVSFASYSPAMSGVVVPRTLSTSALDTEPWATRYPPPFRPQPEYGTPNTPASSAIASLNGYSSPYCPAVQHPYTPVMSVVDNDGWSPYPTHIEQYTTVIPPGFIPNATQTYAASEYISPVIPPVIPRGSSSYGLSQSNTPVGDRASWGGSQRMGVDATGYPIYAP